ncbi:hypothetical protein AtubIFM57258_005913 [Aspergillus tubingensis]|nr:hypothetical protein AtubIFM57258_005913 [Aspergillus tubingensis]
MSRVQNSAAAIGAHRDGGESRTSDDHRVKEENKVLTTGKPSAEEAIFRNEASISFIDTREDICEVIEALMDTPATPPSI